MLIFDFSLLIVVWFSIETLMTLFFTCGLKKKPFDQVRNVSLCYSLPQRSARFLKRLAVGISHNVFSHRETSSQHEQRRNVARVWERLSG